MAPKIIYEDEYLLVVDKPAGLLVHETAAHEPETLANWFVEKYPNRKNLDWPDSTRPGIVHRLDKDTSGLLILAKTPEMLAKLQAMFKERENIKKYYTALTFGKVNPSEGKIEADIVRHANKDFMTVQPITFSFNKGTARASTTIYKTISNFIYKKQNLTLVEVELATGRMHQIRVHFKFLGYPLIGDQMYFIKPSKRLSKELGLVRQFLHSTKLEFIHPETGESLKFESDLPEDLKEILKNLTK